MGADSDAFTFVAAKDDAGLRLDFFLVDRLKDCSRSALAGLIRSGDIRVDDALCKPGYRVKDGDRIHGSIPPPEPISFAPEAMDLDVLFEDNYLVVLNKPAGQVVHPAPGHTGGTLVNGLLHRYPGLMAVGGKLRPGIVHRLDKDTSGCLVVAKNDLAHRRLSAQFKARQATKIYLALVYGRMPQTSGQIVLPIGRHRIDRKKMSVNSRKARRAETHWRLQRSLNGCSLLRLDLKTGRTHQIRVHCAAIGHPVMGDAVYGGRRSGRGLKDGTGLPIPIPRQMLHARRLGFRHPVSEQALFFEAPVPADMQRVIDILDRL